MHLLALDLVLLRVSTVFDVLLCGFVAKSVIQGFLWLVNIHFYSLSAINH